jgi:ABC-type antimicrobial peptide transport system permease subunit
VIGFSVGARRREFGIRMALGALPGAVRRMVLAQGMRLVAIGLVIGLVGAFLLSRLWSGLLYDVAPTDPLTYAAVAIGLAGVAAGGVLPAGAPRHVGGSHGRAAERLSEPGSLGTY